MATEYITINDGRRNQDAQGPRVVITRRRACWGTHALTMAGSRMEPIATTVARLEPDTAANSAQASTRRPRPPCQWPTMAVANLIIRRATPPWVRIAAGNEERDRHDLELSMPVNSLVPPTPMGIWSW